MAALGLYSCAWSFFAAGECTLASLLAFVAESGLCRVKKGLVTVAVGLSCPVTFGIFLDQVLNQCLLHCKTDS